jgi:hypothetical protein
MRARISACLAIPLDRQPDSTYSYVTGSLVSPEDDLAWLLATQVTRPVLFAQAMAQAARAADLIVIAGPDAGLADRAAECGGVPAVAIAAGRGALTLPDAPAGRGRGSRPGRPGRPGLDRPGPDQMALAQAVAALFAAGAVTDLGPYLGQPRATASGGTLASRTVPRMRPAEPLAPAAEVSGRTGAANGAGAADRAGAADGTGPRSAACSAG